MFTSFFATALQPVEHDELRRCIGRDIKNFFFVLMHHSFYSLRSDVVDGKTELLCKLPRKLNCIVRRKHRFYYVSDKLKTFIDSKDLLRVR